MLSHHPFSARVGPPFSPSIASLLDCFSAAGVPACVLGAYAVSCWRAGVRCASVRAGVCACMQATQRTSKREWAKKKTVSLNYTRRVVFCVVFGFFLAHPCLVAAPYDFSFLVFSIVRPSVFLVFIVLGAFFAGFWGLHFFSFCCSRRVLRFIVARACGQVW